MKNIILKASAFCLLLITLSCAKTTEYIAAQGEGGGAKLSFKINGTTYSSWSQTTSSLVNMGGLKLLSINGVGTNSTFTLNIGDFSTAKDYTVGGTTAIMFVPNTQNAAMLVGSSGVIKVTSATGSSVKGTFSGVLEDENGNTKNITDGTFEVSYTTVSM